MFELAKDAAWLKSSFSVSLVKSSLNRDLIGDLVSSFILENDMLALFLELLLLLLLMPSCLLKGDSLLAKYLRI